VSIDEPVTFLDQVARLGAFAGRVGLATYLATATSNVVAASAGPGYATRHLS
jgi:hypothetical protein